MTAKEYLRQLKNLEIKIAQRRQERDRLIAEAMGNNIRWEISLQTRQTSSARLTG